jgi:hypothetical protein
MALAFHWAYVDAKDLLWIILSGAAAFSWLFWKLERRNRENVRIVVNTAAGLETQMQVQDGGFTALTKSNVQERTHSDVLDMMFRFAIAVFIAGALYYFPWCDWLFGSVRCA